MPTNSHEQQQVMAAPRGDTAGLGAVVNTALVGIPLAYATTGSVPVTVIAATSAMVLALIARRGR